jgi:hypothetical protein
VIITTTDPITGEEIRHPQLKPYVIEGTGHLAVKIHFESEETRRQYLDRAAGESATGARRPARTRNLRDRASPRRHADTKDGGLSNAVS